MNTRYILFIITHKLNKFLGGKCHSYTPKGWSRGCEYTKKLGYRIYSAALDILRRIEPRCSTCGDFMGHGVIPDGYGDVIDCRNMDNTDCEHIVKLFGSHI